MQNNKPAPLHAALKIWFVGILSGPIFFYLGSALYGLVDIFSMDSDAPFLWGIMVLYGAALSLPSLALLWLALSVQYRRRQSEYGSWLTALAITFVLTAVPFVVISILTGLGMYVFGFAAAYLGGIWLGVYWAFGRTKFEQPLLGDEPLDANI